MTSNLHGQQLLFHLATRLSRSGLLLASRCSLISKLCNEHEAAGSLALSVDMLAAYKQISNANTSERCELLLKGIRGR